MWLAGGVCCVVKLFLLNIDCWTFSLCLLPHPPCIHCNLSLFDQTILVALSVKFLDPALCVPYYCQNQALTFLLALLDLERGVLKLDKNL